LVKVDRSDLIKKLMKDPNYLIKNLIKKHQSKNDNKMPRLKDIIYVDQADVEIIKLNFMNMMVDISIGQHGGLCTLDFMNHFNE